MGRLRILLIGYMHGRGGIQSHTHYLASGLVERGHAVSVLTPAPFTGHDPVNPSGRPYDLATYESVTDVARYRSPAGPFDVGVVCGTGWSAMLGVRANRAIKKRVFFEVMSGERAKRLDPRMIVHWGFNAIVGQAKPVEARFCDEFNWSGERITIPALPEPLETQVDIAVRSRSDLNSVGELRLAYFGRLAPHKGVKMLIERWDELSQWGKSLDIWGGGEQFDELDALIKSKGLEGVVRLCGRYPDGADYVALLQNYDLKLLPTVGAEGAPLVLLEAMACGLPFVANGVGGIPDYDNVDARITDGNIADFFPLIADWVSAHQRDEIDPARLQRHYSQHFSFSRLVDRWENFFRNLSAQTASRSVSSDL